MASLGNSIVEQPLASRRRRVQSPGLLPASPENGLLEKLHDCKLYPG